MSITPFTDTTNNTNNSAESTADNTGTQGSERSGNGRRQTSRRGTKSQTKARGNPNAGAGGIRNNNPNFKGATSNMNGHVFLTFDECNDKSMFQTTLLNLGMYIDKEMD